MIQRLGCDEVIEPYNEETRFNGKNITCRTQAFYSLLAVINNYIIIDTC